jgi:SAM-dependent methyltransferase
MSEGAVDAAIASLPLAEGATLLETGCGNGELLIRAVRAHPDANGHGIDLDADAIAEAREHAGDLPLRFTVQDAAAPSERCDAVINVASSHVHGGFPEALEVLRELAPVLLFGEGFWARPPQPDFLDALGGATEDELTDLTGLRAAMRQAGFHILCESLASLSDWAHYEETLAGNAESHGGADCLAYARQIRDRRALTGGTDTLGFGLFVLRRA